MTFACEHCSRTFKRESAFLKHACEQKRRWQDRNSIAVQLALEAYCRFYRQYQPSQKQKDWKHFASSSYYSAFVRFAKYTLEVRCINTSAFIDYVIQNNVKLDHWTKDSVYEQFLLSWLKVEDPWDAVKRSLITAADWAIQQQSHAHDYFRYASASKILADIDRGQISPWLLLCSTSGAHWLNSLNSDQVGFIYKWIDPQIWTKKINEYEQCDQLRSVLQEVGL
jgi:hypothetical protein